MRDVDDIIELATEPPDLDDWDRDDIALLYVQVDDLYRLLREYRSQLAEEIGHIMDGQEDDSMQVRGAVILADRRQVVTDSAQKVRDKVYPQLRRHLVDPESGDRVEAIVMDDVQQLLEVKKSPRNLRPFGVHTTWRTSLKVVR